MATTVKTAALVSLCLMLITCRVGYFILTPLWLDFFRESVKNGTDNDTTDPGYTNSSDHNIHNINVTFVLIIQWSIPTLLHGICLVITCRFFPQKITELERTFPKSQFLIMGSSQALSFLLFNFALSGQRTAPYLQAILANFTIPIQFIIRFLVLRKRPSCAKAACASAVVVAEVVSLIPSIFPQLETHADHAREGGATGAGAVLWPLCLVASQIPFALSNTILERSVQKKGSNASGKHLNLFFFLFWWNLFVLITSIALFWADIIPGFGTTNGFKAFAESFAFNVACIFGSSGCGPDVFMLGWGVVTLGYFCGIAFAVMMRYSEGANFVIIILALRTPLVFIFWTLFEEHPFSWNPELDLSTWLSIGSIAVMLPAIALYELAPPEASRPTEEKPEDQQNLLSGSNTSLNYSTVSELH